MAQAARLSLRMQKELKLLLTDPPPGASFPFLSPDSDQSSLSSIDAQIEGPEGTVYAKGIFKIKIQIPERYPFQPPIVTFVTPIYHPNIDNGGRICLDILNLPPKGAWQPSMNISSVVTSIGLLLSEPNPDDGLMCEASREYKYNRQVFDHKARSMIEKYAQAGAEGEGSSSQCIQTISNPSMVEAQAGDKGSKHDNIEFASTDENQSCISSFKHSSSTEGCESDTNKNKAPDHHLFPLDNLENQMEIKGKRKDENSTLNECKLNQEKPHGIRRKLSLESSGQFKKSNDDNKENIDPNCCQSVYNPLTTFLPSSGTSELLISNNQRQQLCQSQDDQPKRFKTNPGSKPLLVSQKNSLDSSQYLSMASKKKLLLPTQPLLSKSHSVAANDVSPIPLRVNISEELRSENTKDRTGNASASTKIKKNSSFGNKLSLGLKGLQRQENNRENDVPVHQLQHLKPESPCRNSGLGRKLSLGPHTELGVHKDDHRQENLTTDASESEPVPKDCGLNEKQQSKQEESTKTGKDIKEHENEETDESESVIVLDSEESEEEDRVSQRSRLSLARKRVCKSIAKA